MPAGSNVCFVYHITSCYTCAMLPPCWSCKGQKEKPPRSSTRRPEPATGPNVGATWACGTSRAGSGNRSPICDISTSRCGGDMLSLRHKAARMFLGENGKAVTLSMPWKLRMVVNSHDSALCKIRQVKANGCLRTPGCPRGIPNSELVFLEMPVDFPEQSTLCFGQV